MPQGLPLGGKWIEDITWIEPVTECANTNLTIELAAGNSPFNITNVELIDNGGFIDLAHTLPYPDELKSSQDPNLSVRALQGAYMGNTLLMYHLNVSIPNNTGPRNTFFGRRFSLDFDLDQQIDRIGTSKLRPRFLKFSSEPDQETSSNVSSSSDTKFDFSDYDWTDIEILCKGSGSKRPKVSNVHIMCGYLYGAPRLIDEGDPRIFQPRSKWNQSLYVCASGVRSSIKTVEFSAKGTASLENLNITRVQDKVYQKKGQWPLWAVERTYKPTFDAPPLWGIVAKKHKKAKDLSTIRAKRFWIPATGSSRGIKTSLDSMTSTRAFAAVLDSTYAISTDNDLATAYTGSQNAALKRLWQELSQSPDTASRIINLIYTEILATTTVGTKSAIVSPTQKGSNSLNRVVQNERRLQYDLRYAIPAIAELLIVTLVMIALIVCFLSGFSFEKMSQLLNQTSTGRIVTNLLYPDICEPGAKTKDWAHAAGEIKLRYPFTKHANIEEKKGLHGNESAFNGDGASAGLLKHDTDVHITQTNSSTT
ncbi:MAG: hypothetical protein LQ342_002350 [Letrouitia transgressa]|nr:MAG: hypothetical protein LQ342_002350 [Letrouitia transgressa]